MSGPHSSQSQSQPIQASLSVPPPPAPSTPQHSITPPSKGPTHINTKAVIQHPPLSPEAKEREKERISLLLVINGELLQEVVKLQAEGKAGAPQASPKQTPGGLPSKEESAKDGELEGKMKKGQPSPEYIE